MPLKLKQKQITVQVSELTIELDQTLTKLLTDAAEAAQVEPDAYVLALLHERLQPETAEAAPEKPAATKPVNLQAKGTAPVTVTSPTAAKTPPPPRVAKGPKPRYVGKLTELVASGDEGSDIALELKDKGLITAEQYEAVLNGEIPKGKPSVIGPEAQNYIVEQLAKAEAGSDVIE
jgi:hypothetical protein